MPTLVELEEADAVCRRLEDKLSSSLASFINEEMTTHDITHANTLAVGICLYTANALAQLHLNSTEPHPRCHLPTSLGLILERAMQTCLTKAPTHNKH